MNYLRGKQLVFLGLTIFSCVYINPVYAHAQTEKKASKAVPSFNIPTELKVWNEKQPLPLQEHQLVPIAYLEQNKDIKGLVINHWLGTGKTLLAIGFAERHSDQSVIILGPDFLKGHWEKEFKKYGIKNKNRYRFVSHDSANILSQEDLSNSILIIDESHRLIEKLRSPEEGAVYAPLYLHLQKAHRILSLTGTPIYNDAFDIVYQINLVSGKEEFPFNREAFRINYSKIDGFKSYWRGYLLSSHYMAFSGTFLGEAISGYLFQLLYSILPPVLLPLNSSPIRTFDPEKLMRVVHKYISYYNFEKDACFYPSQSLSQNLLNYNEIQLDILYRFYDSHLAQEELDQLCKDQTVLKSNQVGQKANNYINNSLMQDLYKRKVGAGREIGNLLFVNALEIEKDAQNKGSPHNVRAFQNSTNQYTIFPEKFELILNQIQESKGPVVVYSHYYYNGLLLFKQFLDANGYQEKYKIFHPKQSSGTHTKIVEEYNNQKIKILLLHPDVTEGISLQGTQQVHFLELPVSSELSKQIVGRAIRYKSHMHLPENERHVAIYHWYYVLGWYNPNVYVAARENWYQSFSEVTYYNSINCVQIDPNYLLKTESPDMRSYAHFSMFDKLTSEFRKYAKNFCIENMYSKV